MPYQPANVNTFAEAYTMFYPHVYNTLYIKTRDPDVTHDLCQEVFLRFYNKFDSIDNHRRWIFSAAKYILLEHYRTVKSEYVDLEQVENDVRMSFVNGFRDTRVMIEEALDSLEHFDDELGRQIFDLIAVFNYTYRETASSLGISERQVRYRYKLITDHLMEYFRKRGIHGMEDLL